MYVDGDYTRKIAVCTRGLRGIEGLDIRSVRLKGYGFCAAIALVGCIGDPEAVASTKSDIAQQSFRDCASCPEMVPLSPEIVGKALSFSAYELTWAQYAEAVDAAGCPLPHTLADKNPTVMSEAVRDDFPMTSLPPAEIDCYLDWLSTVSGKRYRLPTEAEWAAVAKVAYPGTIKRERPEFEPGASRDPRTTVRRRVIRRVGGQYHPAVGLFDLFGNATEVVSSDRGDKQWAIVRGGNDFRDEDFDAVDEWRKVPANSSSVSVGFRIVREGQRS